MNVQTSTSNARSPFRRKTVSPFDPTDFGASLVTRIDRLARSMRDLQIIVATDRARHFTVFAGEVMAEVLGHFPWDFERMLDSVIAFERSIGLRERRSNVAELCSF